MRKVLGKKALVLFSSGQDSMTSYFWAQKNFEEVEAVFFDYGQRHLVEWTTAMAFADRENLKLNKVDLSFLTALNQNALTSSDTEINLTGGFNSLPSTFVPGRNIFFLSIAASYALPRDISHVVTGVCQTDYSGYPDCREDFIQSIQKTLSLGIGAPLKIHTPLMHLTKAETFQLADDLGILARVLSESHTCYRGLRDQLWSWGYGCDDCPACELRKKGFFEFMESKNISTTIQEEKECHRASC